MKRLGSGVIINNGSMAGVRPQKLGCAYATSKGAVITFTKALAAQLAPHNIRVNCVNPVFTETPLTGGVNEEWKNTVVSGIPLGRTAMPKDIAYAVLYLASDESSMVTGTCLNVDGGRGI